MSRVFAPENAMVTAKLEATVVLPSPGMALVNMSTFGRAPATGRKMTEERKVRNDSSKAWRESSAWSKAYISGHVFARNLTQAFPPGSASGTR